MRYSELLETLNKEQRVLVEWIFERGKKLEFNRLDAKRMLTKVSEDIWKYENDEIIPAHVAQHYSELETLVDISLDLLTDVQDEEPADSDTIEYLANNIKN